MKQVIKEILEPWKETYKYFLKPLVSNFFKLAPGRTFLFAMLVGFNLSVFFEKFYTVVVFISFIASIYLFVKLYTISRDQLLKEEKEEEKSNE